MWGHLLALKGHCLARPLGSGISPALLVVGPRVARQEKLRTVQFVGGDTNRSDPANNRRTWGPGKEKKMQRPNFILRPASSPAWHRPMPDR